MAATTIFSPQQLSDIVSSTLAASAVPDGHKNAVIAGVDQDGAHVVAAFKLGSKDQWEFNGAFEHTWEGDNQVGASLIYSF